MIDPQTGALCERIASNYYSSELQVMLTTGQRHKPLPPDARPHTPYGLPALPANGNPLVDHKLADELNGFIAHRMADPTRRAFILFTPFSELEKPENRHLCEKARPYTAEGAGLSLLVNPHSRHLEAYDLATQTVSQFPVRNLDPQVAFSVLSICEMPATASIYNEGLQKVMTGFLAGRTKTNGTGPA